MLKSEFEMNTKKIYSPWIKWYGGECPVPTDTIVGVKFRRGAPEREERAGRYFWNHEGDDEDDDIVEYRTVTEHTVLEAAEQLLRANGYTVTKPLTFEDVEPMTEAPPSGTEYWVVLPTVEDGVHRIRFCGGFDFTAIKHRMAYLDKEHALIAARHIFGLKGG